MDNAANIDKNPANDKTSKHIISQSNNYRVKSRSEIRSLLGKLSKNHTLLSITIGKSPRTFGSMILEVNNEKGYLVLDELYPRKELKTPLLHAKLAINTHLDGIEIHFQIKVDAISRKDDVEYYRAGLPAYIHHHQRRAYYRVKVGIAEPVPIALSTTDDVLLHADLRDISLGGIGASFSSPTTEALSVGDEIPNCIIHTPDGKEIVSSMEIARVEETSSSKAIRVGARFIHITSADRQELSKLIAKLDRENIKKLKRLRDTG